MGRWVPLAEREGGTVVAIALSPSPAADQLAFAATSTGIFRSRDGGRSWEVSSKDLGSLVVQSITLSPLFAEDRTLFAGAADGGVYRSTDAGDNWTLLARVGGGSAVVALAVAPGAGGGAALMAGTLADGVFASADGGRNWSAHNSGLADLSAIALAMSPVFEGDRTAFVATESGLYLTADGGDSWKRVWAGEGEDGVQCLEVSPGFGTDRTVLAGTEERGVLRSTDGGATWHRLDGGLPDPCVNALALSPDFPHDGVAMAGTGRGVALTTDGGESWRPVAAETEVVLSVGVSGGSASGPRVVLAGLADEGMLRSEDGGLGWAAANRGLVASSLVGLALSPGFESDATLFTWGSSEGVLRSEDGGRSWQPASAGLEGATVSRLALSPAFADDGALYAATSAGVFHGRDRGATWHGLGLEDQEVSLLALSPAFAREPLVVAAAGEALHRSSNGGADWSALEAPAVGETPVALAVALDARGWPVLLVGTWREPSGDNRGRLRVWSRTLAEPTWACLFSRPTSTRVTALAVPDSFGQNRRFFIGNEASVYRLIPDAREKTREGEWPLWLPAAVGSRGYPVVSLAAAPDFARGRTLLAAGREGVFVSTDEGVRWRRLGEAPGGRPALAVAPAPRFGESGVVYALSLGGQLWRWDPAG